MIGVLAFVALIVIATGLPTGLWARRRRKNRDAFVLDWAEFANWCCLRGWQTHGEKHDRASCREARR